MNIQTKKRSRLHYVYEMECKETNQFYIGSHTCTKKSNTCRGVKCNYQGSSSSMRELQRQNPSHTWTKKIICYAQDKQTLAKLEKKHIRENIDHPSCLNHVVASPSRLPIYTSESLLKLKKATRSKRISMISDDGEIIEVSREDIDKFFDKGLRFYCINVYFINVELKKTCLLGKVTANGSYEYARKHGWTFGFDSSYQKISTSDYLNSCYLEKKEIVIRKTEFIYSQPKDVQLTSY